MTEAASPRHPDAAPSPSATRIASVPSRPFIRAVPDARSPRDHAALRLEPGAPAASAEALIEAAQAAERQGRRDEARDLYEAALYRLKDPAQGPLASALLRWVGRTYQEEADAAAALDCHEAALAVARACDDEAGVGHAINMQAAVYWQQGRLDEAERLFLDARESALRAGDGKLAAVVAQNLGVIANVRGDLPKALQHYEASLADHRALGLAKDVWGTLNNLGKLYTDLGRWDAAERSYEEALQIVSALGDLSARVRIEVNFAVFDEQIKSLSKNTG